MKSVRTLLEKTVDSIEGMGYKVGKINGEAVDVENTVKGEIFIYVFENPACNGKEVVNVGVKIVERDNEGIYRHEHAKITIKHTDGIKAYANRIHKVVEEFENAKTHRYF